VKRHRAQSLAALLVGCALVASACAGSDDDTAPVTDSETSTEEAADEADLASEPDADAGDDPAEIDTSEADTPEADDAPPPTQLTSEQEGVDETDLTPQSGGEIIYGIPTDGTGFTTTGAIPSGSLRIATALNDSLVAVNEDGDWVPNLAQALTPNDDFTEWTITLRPDVEFHDGVAVDAAAVAANINAVKASPTTGFTLGALNEATATGDLDVTVTMNTSWAAFPYILIGQTGFMVSPETIGTNESFVGTGPFVLESWAPGDTARVVRNENYWRASEGFPYLDAITFKVIPEATARSQALAAGDIQGFSNPGDGLVLDALDDDDTDVFITEATSNEALVILNTTAAPTDDLRIRTAMAYALDRQLLIDTFRSGLTTPANSFISPTSPWFTETDYPAFDLEAATALVDEYEAEVGPAEISFKVSNSPGSVEVVETIAALWTAAGIDTTVEEIAEGTEVTPVISDDFQAIYWFQFGAADPDAEYVFFHSSGGPINWSNLIDPDIDAGFDQGRASNDPAERAAGYARVQEALASQLPMLWIDHLGGVEGVIVSPDLRGVSGGTLPEGDQSLTTGGYFSWEDVWIG
jgi:peptide/nickel transport system substrate-binding protein